MGEPTVPTFITLRPGHPDYLDLPWGLSLPAWPGNCPRLEEVARGLSRHPVLFVNYDGVLYALKELPAGLQRRNMRCCCMEEERLPCVVPIGHAQTALRAKPAY
jgi:hypothetical protein